MVLEPLPGRAGWRHVGAREGSEVVFIEHGGVSSAGRASGTGTIFTGCTVAVESGEPWIVDYRLVVDERWHTRSAEVTARSSLGRRALRLDHDGHGGWLLDGSACPQLDGCLDVDLEASALTNTLPVHRFASESPTGAAISAPAAFVRAQTLAVERLEQTYRRVDDAPDGPDGPDGPRFAYSAPIFDVSCVLGYDRSGLVRDYPGLAVRISIGPEF